MKEKLKIPFFKYIIGSTPENKYNLEVDQVEYNPELIVKAAGTSYTGGSLNHSLTDLFIRTIVLLKFDELTNFLQYHFENYEGEKLDFINYVLPIMENLLNEVIEKKDYQRKFIYESGVDWLKGKLSCDREFKIENTGSYINEKLVDQLKGIKNQNFDTTKIIVYLEEINSNYNINNIISTSLLIRAFLNHIPIIFDQSSFKSFVNQSSKSLKESLAPLEDQARKIADYHTHIPITKKEFVPSLNQIEPFKGGFEILVQEIIRKLNE